MKKLSEIGWFGRFCDNDPGSPHILHDRDVAVLSFEERRELVEGAIKRFVNKCLMGWKREDWRGDEHLKEFLKDEEL